MKKRLISLALALVAVLSLAAPAFAEESADPYSGNFIYDLDDPEMRPSKAGKRGSYLVRKIIVKDSGRGSGIATYGEPEVPSKYLYVHTLSAGTEFTLRGLRPTQELSIHIYSSHDGDSFYDTRFFTKAAGKGYSLLPCAEEYEYDTSTFVEIFLSASELSDADILSGIGIQTSQDESGTVIVTFDSDSIYEVFGTDTMIHWGVIEELTSSDYGDLLITKDEPVPEFTDTPSWCAKEAQWAAEKGITKGYGGSTTFAPGINCSQAEILTFLHRAENKSAAGSKSPFTVASYYQDAVDWAYEKGIISDDFTPGAPCTRAQAVTYIWKARNELEAKEAASFSDVDADSPIAPAVSWAVEKGVTKGYGGADTFAPDRVCTRGEIACFLYRAYN